MSKDITVGTIVKSFDFHGNTECYYIGEVIAVMDYGFRAKTLKQVVAGKQKDITMGRNDYFQAPFNGNSMFDETFPSFERVVVVG